LRDEVLRKNLAVLENNFETDILGVKDKKKIFRLIVLCIWDSYAFLVLSNWMLAKTKLRQAVQLLLSLLCLCFCRCGVVPSRALFLFFSLA
jgi:hypothetical protein